MIYMLPLVTSPMVNPLDSLPPAVTANTRSVLQTLNVMMISSVDIKLFKNFFLLKV